jgi:hypothetical protein
LGVFSWVEKRRDRCGSVAIFPEDALGMEAQAETDSFELRFVDDSGEVIPNQQI